MTRTDNELDEVLFVHDDGPVSQRAIVDAFTKVGLRGGDTCLVHSSLFRLGRPAVPKEHALERIVEAFEHVLGPDGTLIMPTYTFSFCNDQPFDVERSPSTSGALTEYFRGLRGVVRSRHPIYSHAMRGPNAELLVQTNNRDCFGIDTFFAKLKELDGKIITFGSGFPSTFKHHVEQAHGVPYRFLKTFRGYIVDDHGEREETCTFYVRRLETGFVKRNEGLQQRMVDAGLLEIVWLAGAEITRMSARDLFEQTWQMLEEDVYSLVQKSGKPS